MDSYILCKSNKILRIPNFPTSNLGLQSQAMYDHKCWRQTFIVVHSFETSNYNTIPFLQGITRIFPNVYLDSFIETVMFLQAINLINHQIYNFHSHIYITKYFMEQFS